MKKNLRFLSLLLCVTLVIGLMPITAIAAQQEISAVVATSSNLEAIPKLYGSLKTPTFTLTQGSPAYINASTRNLNWQKNIEGVWTNQYSGYFTPGEWRISTSLRLDGDGALHYDFAQNLTFEVNGAEWIVETPGNHGEYSYAWVYSPVYTIVDDPNMQPPVAVETVHMVLNGYAPGAAIASATVTTDANVTVEVLGFIEAIDTDGDGQPDTPEAATGNFVSGKLYAVALQIKAKPGYDISGLTLEKVFLDRAVTPIMGEYSDDEEVFAGMCMLTDAMQYTVTFETNGGSEIQPVSVGRGGAVAEPTAPTKAYYAFAGWYSDSELTQEFDFNTPISGDTTLYAKWTPSPVGGMFLMTIDLNGGIIEMAMPLIGEVPANETMFFTDDLGGYVVHPDGKVFAGYEIDGVPYNPAEGHLVTQNFTLKLLWEDSSAPYTIRFAAGGGSGTMADVTDFVGEFVLPECAFAAPAGKAFKGWRVDSTLKYPGDTIIVSKNIVLFAEWVDISLDSNSILSAPVSVVKPVAGATSISGSCFATEFYNVSIGWSTTQDGSTMNDFNDKTFEAGKTYYADLYLISKDPYIFDESTNIAVNGNIYPAQWTIGAEYKKYVAVYDVPFTVPAPKNGWVKESGKWFFFENGNMVTNKWKKDSIGWCYLGADGAMKTNAWVMDSYGWCYVGANGYCVTNKWMQDSTKKWCYLNANGNMVVSSWVLDGGKWYFMDANGYMVTNKWMKDSIGWVYLGSNGYMMTNAWVMDSFGWCYVGADGYAVTNTWKMDSHGWCYLGNEGSQVKNNWVFSGGKWYFIDADGYMIFSTSKYWNGKTYYFNANGVCTNP